MGSSRRCNNLMADVMDNFEWRWGPFIYFYFGNWRGVGGAAWKHGVFDLFLLVVLFAIIDCIGFDTRGSHPRREGKLDRYSSDPIITN